MRGTVRFAEGLGELLQEPGRVYLEVGPGATLGTLVKQHPDAPAGAVTASALRRGSEGRSDVEHLLEAVGRLWLAGVEIDWERLRGDERRLRVPLPTYPFERQRYWVDPPKGGKKELAPADIDADHREDLAELVLDARLEAGAAGPDGQWQRPRGELAGLPRPRRTRRKGRGPSAAGRLHRRDGGGGQRLRDRRERRLHHRPRAAPGLRQPGPEPGKPAAVAHPPPLGGDRGRAFLRGGAESRPVQPGPPGAGCDQLRGPSWRRRLADPHRDGRQRPARGGGWRSGVPGQGDRARRGQGRPPGVGAADLQQPRHRPSLRRGAIGAPGRAAPRRAGGGPGRGGRAGGGVPRPAALGARLRAHPARRGGEHPPRPGRRLPGHRRRARSRHGDRRAPGAVARRPRGADRAAAVPGARPVGHLEGAARHAPGTGRDRRRHPAADRAGE